MTDAAADPPEEVPAKSGKLPLILGLVLALVGAGAGFFAVSSGMLPLGGASHDAAEGQAGDSHGAAGESKDGDHGTGEDLSRIAFVPLDPIVVSLAQGGQLQHLQFRAQLEVEAARRQEVELILPRVIDVLNDYLRALEFSDLRDPMALARLRAQMLRRVQIVVGKDRVRDLLIMDFVLN
ncbi:flagellar basal body-associated FliL family protein [Albibacillus kandeliae]|uniref:flagellar basal body-associated FliL family protein n=1 Tax=Albibacillus kandeliae TaxID=2174228 RepID=UPI000D68880D|nr:flagellar basal body-associated FliL family protein [Albibacillus kandeliae]